LNINVLRFNKQLLACFVVKLNYLFSHITGLFLLVNQNKVLIVFVDAFGPDQLEGLKELFGFLPHKRTLHGILGYSSGALPTVLTGATPEEHGRMCLFSARQSGETSILRPMKWLGLLPKFVHERSRVRRLAEKLLKRTAGLEGYVALHKVPPEMFEWLDMPERDDMFQAPEIGDARTFLADARDAGLSVYSAPWQLQEAQRWRHSLEALESQKPDLAFLYATALDGIMHKEGPGGSEVPEAAERIAVNIERARDIMASDGSNLTTLVVGDHGMAEVKQFLDPRQLLARLGEIRLFVDSTMIRAWGTDSELSQLRLEIEKENWLGTWLHGGELRARKVPKNEVFGRAIYVLDEGCIFAPSFLGGRVAGMHGYDTGCACSKAALASDRPIDENVRGIDDIAGVVRNRLGLV
jgi:hypothetical protein